MRVWRSSLISPLRFFVRFIIASKRKKNRKQSADTDDSFGSSRMSSITRKYRRWSLGYAFRGIRRRSSSGLDPEVEASVTAAAMV